METIHRIKTLFKWIALMLFAILILCFSPVFFIVNLFKLFFRQKIGRGIDRLAIDIMKTAYTLDILANVTIFCWLDFKTDRHNYGSYSETVSFVLARRYETNKLTWCDSVIFKIILIFDRRHFSKGLFN